MITQKLIRKYAKKIGRKFQVERVILFGSYARNDATEDSDVDLLVIMDHDKPRNVEQVITMRLQEDAPFPLDMLVKRPSEVDERLAVNDSFIKNILGEGKVLYG